MRRGLGLGLLLGGGLALALGGLLLVSGRAEIDPVLAFLATVALTAGLALCARDPGPDRGKPQPGAGRESGGNGGNSPGGTAEGEAGDPGGSDSGT